MKPLLEVRGCSLTFRRYRGTLGRTRFSPLTDLSLSVSAGEVVAVLGASGSGKSLLAHAILGILPENARLEGELRFRGEPLTPKRAAALRGREIALVPQRLSFLNPLMRVGAQVQGKERGPKAAARAQQLLSRYGLPEDTAHRYPFELSGGMARRVLIATAMMHDPVLVIADEPTPGLHEAAARRVLGHFREMADEGAGVLLITHALEQALLVADRLVVLYAGQSIEEALVGDFACQETLRHPYTRALWQAMPQHGFLPLAGGQPGIGEAATGCAFRDRCVQSMADCAGDVPYRATSGGRVRCLRDLAEVIAE